MSYSVTQVVTQVNGYHVEWHVKVERHTNPRDAVDVTDAPQELRAALVDWLART